MTDRPSPEELLRRILAAPDAPSHCHTNPGIWDGGGPCVYCTALNEARTLLNTRKGTA